MIVRICWVERPAGICGGRVEWRHEGGYWRSRCSRCKAEGRAASGEAAQLDLEVAP